MNELENEKLENQIPGEENPEAEQAPEANAETGAAENGEVNEAPVEGEPAEENVANDVSEEENPEVAEPEPEPQEKMLTQSQVNELVGKARAEGRAAGKAEAMNELYGRYGVNDDNEMNDIFGKGQGYDLLTDEYNTLNGNFKNVSAENALLKSGVVQGRWDDVKAILGSKGMDITVENIQSEIATHPEWQNSTAANVENAPEKEITPEMGEALANSIKPKKTAPAETSTIRKFGSDVPDANVDLEQSKALKMFGV